MVEVTCCLLSWVWGGRAGGVAVKGPGAADDGSAVVLPHTYFSDMAIAADRGYCGIGVAEQTVPWSGRRTAAVEPGPAGACTMMNARTWTACKCVATQLHAVHVCMPCKCP